MEAVVEVGVVDVALGQVQQQRVQGACLRPDPLPRPELPWATHAPRPRRSTITTNTVTHISSTSVQLTI